MTKTAKNLLGMLVLVLLVTGGLFYFGYLKQAEKKVSTSSEPVLVDRDKLVVGNNANFVSGPYPSEMMPSNQEIGSYSNVYQALASFNKSGRLLPGSGLAINWTNPDPTIWRFVIDPNAKFSDNTPVLASDVKFTYDTIIKNNYQIGTLLPLIKEVKVTDDRTVDFITETPNPTLVNKLSSLLIVSEKDVTANGVKSSIGSGPYKLVVADSTKGELRHFVVNENYWKAAPKVKEVIVKNIVPKDAETQDEAYANALLSKEIDMAPIFGKDTTKQLKVNPNLTSKSWQDAAVSFISINTLADTPLKNLEVRKAIMLGFNPETISAVIATPTQIVDQIVPVTIFGYNPDIKRPVMNVTEAKSKLTTAGYPNGFKLKFMSYEGQEVEGLNAFKAEFAKIGITLEIDEAKGTDYMSRLLTGNYITTLVGFSADSGDASEVLEQLFHTKGTAFGTSNFGYSNTAVDTLIEKTASTMDMKQRQADLKQTIKLITDDVAYIPLFNSVSNYFIDKDIYWQPRVDGYLKFNEMAGLE